MYYGRYLNFLEAARGAFFVEAGTSFASWQEAGFTFPVIECRLRYKTPARYDETLEVAVTPTQLEGIRLNFGYRIRNPAGKTVVEAETQHICASLNEKPRRLPPELITRLTPFLQTAAT